MDEEVVKVIPKINARVFRVPATKIAETELKSKLYTNVVMLGALTKITALVSREAVEKAIVDSVRDETRDANLVGFKLGLSAGE